MKCRSEPQVVESRTLRIASWGLTITGSLTVSVLMSLTPCQQIARMVARLEPVVLARAGGGILLERWGLAGLEQGLPRAFVPAGLAGPRDSGRLDAATESARVPPVGWPYPMGSQPEA